MVQLSSLAVLPSRAPLHGAARLASGAAILALLMPVHSALAAPTSAVPAAAEVAPSTSSPAGDGPETNRDGAALRPPPRTPGFVIAGHLGTQVFTGALGSVAPPAFLSRLQVGYEPARYALIYAEGELAFTSTSRAQSAPFVRSFPLFGLGAGLRLTVAVSSRVGIYAEASAGAMKADVAYNALAVLGFRDAERLAPYYGLRLGAEWHQIDRHFALTLALGYRRAPGLARSAQTADSPGLVDATLGVRYTL